MSPAKTFLPLDHGIVHDFCMPIPEVMRLIFLSAIWGGSFLFLRIATPEFGPFAVVWLRVTLAAVCLSPILLRKQNRQSLRSCGPGMIVIALLGAAIPFSLLSYATLSLETGTTAVINALTPVFTMLVTLAWVRQSPTRWQVLGLGSGLMGILILTWAELSFEVGGGGWAVAAALIATMCYAVATNFLKIRMPEASAQAVTFGSMAGASLVLAPLAFFSWPEKAVSSGSWVAVVLLAVVSTALAYLIFYRLMTQVSALAATSVTFLVPVFAFLWGGLILGESISFQTVIGMVIAMTGTALTLGLWPRKRSRAEPR